MRGFGNYTLYFFCLCAQTIIVIKPHLTFASHFFLLSLCAFVFIYVHVGGGAYVCGYMLFVDIHAWRGQRQLSSVFLNLSPLYFFFKTGSLTEPGACLPRLAGWWAVGVFMAASSPALGLQVCQAFLQLLGIELGSSCLQDKHFTHWAISMASSRYFLIFLLVF